MKNDTVRKLLAINERFYTEHAHAFDRTRRAPWPGFERVIDRLDALHPTRASAEAPLHVLDVGCGNGRFAHAVFARHPTAHYVGLDTSPSLLAAAALALKPDIAQGRVHLDHANIIDKDAWSRLGEHAFDLIVLFGILHHIPEFDTRLKLMRRAAERLAPGGVLALSFWAFDAQRAKPLEIDAHDIDPDDLEPGDVLLPWDVDGAHRYCHLADETEIDRVAEALARCGLQSLDRFRSDGRSGDANTYLLLSTGRGEGLADAHYDGRNL